MRTSVQTKASLHNRHFDQKEKSWCGYAWHFVPKWQIISLFGNSVLFCRVLPFLHGSNLGTFQNTAVKNSKGKNKLCTFAFGPQKVSKSNKSQVVFSSCARNALAVILLFLESNVQSHHRAVFSTIWSCFFLLKKIWQTPVLSFSLSLSLCMCVCAKLQMMSWS